MKLIDYLLIALIAIMAVIGIIVMKRNSGKCACCSRKDNCPFMKTVKK